jgi:hypothetical protein
MNPHQLKHDGYILIPERGLIYFIAITVLLCFAAFIAGYYWCANDIERIARDTADRRVQAQNARIDSLAARTDSSLVLSTANKACWLAIVHEQHGYTSKNRSDQ